MNDSELKKQMWMRYLLARIFSNEPPIDDMNETSVQQQKPTPEVPKQHVSVPDTRFKALRDKIASSQKEVETNNVNNE